jgi:L-cysteine/cystine lyase
MDNFRSEFILENRIYFNHGGQGLLPRLSINSIYEAYIEIQKRGPFSINANNWISDKILNTRLLLASSLGCIASSLSFTESSTHSMNIILWGLDWKVGDGLMISDAEHPGGILPAHVLASRKGLEIQNLEILGSEDPLKSIRDALKSNTRLLLLSHVIWTTGQVLPIKEITELCRDNGVLVLWDAAQSSGVIPPNFDEWGIDFYASTCHKWWMGPAGIGYLYINHLKLEQILSTYVGWRSASSYDYPFEWHRDGRRFEMATVPNELYFGLYQSLNLIKEHGSAEDHYRKILQLAKHLWLGLQEISGIDTILPASPSSGLVCWTISSLNSEKDYTKLALILESKNIFVRVMPNPVCLRASLHYFNEIWEIDEFLRVIKFLQL